MTDVPQVHTQTPLDSASRHKNLTMIVSPKFKRGFTAAAITTLAIASILIVDDSLIYPEEEPPQTAFDLRALIHRRASINLGDGNCEWTAPLRTVPEDIDFHKTLVAGFPSG